MNVHFGIDNLCESPPLEATDFLKLL